MIGTHSVSLQPGVREFIAKRAQSYPGLLQSFDACVENLKRANLKSREGKGHCFHKFEPSGQFGVYPIIVAYHVPAQTGCAVVIGAGSPSIGRPQKHPEKLSIGQPTVAA